MAETLRDYVLDPSRANQNVIQSKYAVRGLLYHAAQARIKSGKNAILTNVGNPQALGQKPLTFPRQVMALITWPSMLDHPECCKIFPPDAILRAREYLKNMPGGTGAYQDSRGLLYVREEVAQFIAARDGVPAHADCIYLTDGASQGIHLALQVLIRDRNDAILVPIPQYPLYSATIELLNGTLVGYPLNEDTDWSLDISQLRKVTMEARKRGLTIRGLVVINPGNPTGQQLKSENMKELIRFCLEERVVMFADEVYQSNVYSKEPFVSFKKLGYEMMQVKEKSKPHLELFSFHSASKGAWGITPFFIYAITFI